MAEEIYALDLDWDLVNHLAIPESFAELRAERIRADLIEDEYVEKVWHWANEHYREYGEPPSPSVLEDQFEDIAIEEPLTVVGDLIHRLRERYVKNYGRDQIREVGDAWKEDPLSLAHEMIRKGRELAALTQARGESWGTGDIERSIDAYYRQVTRGQGPSFGFQELDDYLYGQRGVTFQLGPPKGMKSWLVVNGVIENILAGRTVHLHSLELPAYESNMRVRCMAADIPWWKFLRNKLEPEDIERLRIKNEEIDDLGTFHVIKPPPEERYGDELVLRSADAGADVVYIDQLQYLNDRNGVPLGDRNETGAYWGVGNKLRDISDDIPITVVHQFNRSVLHADEMPSMQQAKASSMIEEVGTLVLGSWANKEMRQSNVMELGILGSRNFGLASWEVGVEMNRGCNFKILGRVEE